MKIIPVIRAFLFAIVLVPSLCQSSAAYNVVDKTENPYNQYKAIRGNINVVSPKIINHNNGKLCWKNPSLSSNEGIVYYLNGNVCWKDPTVWRNSGGVVYHLNGNVCWKDPTVWSNSGGAVYHLNGNVCWKDPTVWSNSGGAIYHSNGNVCWKDPTVWSNSGGAIYHSNGNVCWKDPIIWNNSGGQCYDSQGNPVGFSGLNNFCLVDLGNNTRLKIWNNGQFQLSVDLGDNNFFVKSFDSEFFLYQNIGSALYFYVPLKSNDPAYWILDNNNNWSKIFEKKS